MEQFPNGFPEKQKNRPQKPSGRGLPDEATQCQPQQPGPRIVSPADAEAPVQPSPKSRSQKQKITQSAVFSPQRP